MERGVEEIEIPGFAGKVSIPVNGFSSRTPLLSSRGVALSGTNNGDSARDLECVLASTIALSVCSASGDLPEERCLFFSSQA